MVLLNATPGKKSYAVTYSSKEDIARRVPDAQNASTIIYRKSEESARWEGLVLGFEWAKTSCSTTGNSIVDKLCDDLWYLEHMDNPEKFVTVIRKFELPEGISPSDWARPGVDPLQMMGLTKKQ
jgi:hypothetical protein